MDAIIDLARSAPEVFDALEHPGRYIVRRSDLEPELVGLVQVFVSSRSGCGECADGYAREAMRSGEGQERLRSARSWSHARTGLYSSREMVALAWAEGLTRTEGAPDWDELRRRVRSEFTERDIADLSLLAIATSGWSRMAVALRTFPPQVADPPERMVRSANALGRSLPEISFVPTDSGLPAGHVQRAEPEASVFRNRRVRAAPERPIMTGGDV